MSNSLAARSSMRTLQSSKKVFHPEAFQGRLAAITDEMRALVLGKDLETLARTDSRLSLLRRLLAEEIASIPDALQDQIPHQGRILATLDPHTIKTLMPPRTFAIDLTLWNQIAPHVTPELIDAYCAAGCDVSDLPYPSPTVTPPPPETLERIVERQRAPDVTLLVWITSAPRYGQLPASLCLKAFRHWLARWPLPTPSNQGWQKLPLCLTLLRLVAALDGHAPDDWEPHNDPKGARALKLTRSAHGRLQLHALLPDLEALIRDPEGQIARLARHVPS